MAMDDGGCLFDESASDNTSSQLANSAATESINNMNTSVAGETMNGVVISNDSSVEEPKDELDEAAKLNSELTGQVATLHNGMVWLISYTQRDLRWKNFKQTLVQCMWNRTNSSRRQMLHLQSCQRCNRRF